MSTRRMQGKMRGYVLVYARRLEGVVVGLSLVSFQEKGTGVGSTMYKALTRGA